MSLQSSSVAWLCSGIVGAVFVFAAVAKFFMGSNWLLQARDLGVPRVAMVFVPWVEFAVGVALLGQVAPRFSYLAAVLLLVAFTTLIISKLLRGQHPQCACFGRRSIKPIGWSNVTRNISLIALVVVAAVVGA